MRSPDGILANWDSSGALYYFCADEQTRRFDIYDYELHPTYYRRYHPDMVVQFEGIKTRGDQTCKFRISLPAKQRSGDPRFPGYAGQDV